MPSYYLHEEQVTKLRALKTPVSSVLGRAVERYRNGDFSGLVRFTDKTHKRDLIPKKRVSVTARFPGINDERMRQILDCHFLKQDEERRKTLERLIEEEEKKISRLMKFFTSKKFILS